MLLYCKRHCTCCTYDRWRLIIAFFSTTGSICNSYCVHFCTRQPFYSVVTFILLPLCGSNACLCEGFALTVMPPPPPSSVNIVRQSKAWQPCRHVLLLSRIQSLILITYSPSLYGFKCILMVGHSSCCLRSELSGWDKESVIDAFSGVADCSAELPHAPIMTHDGNPCQ